MKATPTTRKQPNKAKPDREADPGADRTQKCQVYVARVRAHARARARAPAGRSDDPALKTRFSRRAKTDPRENRSILSRRFLFRNDPQTPYRPKLNCKILPQKIKLASAAAVGRVWQRWLEEGGAQTLKLKNKT